MEGAPSFYLGVVGKHNTEKVTSIRKAYPYDQRFLRNEYVLFSRKPDLGGEKQKGS